jgi:tetratricopeptide (TPR) repeat protein
MKTRITKHARFLKANQLADQGNVLGAAKIFRALQVDDPSDPKVKLPLAVALFQLGDYDGTIKVISEYMDLMPEAYFTHQLRGRAFFKLEKFESALVEFNLEIKKNPSYPEAYCDKAYALIEINRCEEGLASARLALELDPNLAEGYDCMAITMNKLDKPDQALELAKKAINIDRLSPDFHRTLGDIFYNLDDFDNALKAYDKSLNLDNHFTITEFQKSKVYLSTCNFNLGWQAYESRHKLNSSSDKNLYQNFSKIHLHEIKKILIRKEQGIGDQILFSSPFF